MVSALDRVKAAFGGFAEASVHAAFRLPGSPEPAAEGPPDESPELTELLALASRAPEPAALARDAVARFGSVAAAIAAPAAELFALPGFGSHCVAATKLMHEAALRLVRAELARGPPLADEAALLAYLTASLSRERVEQFRILFLDAEARLIADETQARGTFNHAPVYPREVAGRALALDAAALVLVHNHPSGDPTPSEADIAMTQQIRRALDLFGIGLADHLIVGNGTWTSLAREGFLEPR